MNTEKRYRASIYVDIWVEDTGDEFANKVVATVVANDYQKKIPDSYVGGISGFTGNILHPLEEEI